MALAARGRRDMDTGPEAITDPEALARVRRQARGVHLRALVTAAALTAVLLVL
ncbi:MAG TPA: hypothetical protein VE173_15405 [Longimicrobiales bacterium]|nr:hypothetical protein [Longimicrobiales bacterium]